MSNHAKHAAQRRSVAPLARLLAENEYDHVAPAAVVAAAGSFDAPKPARRRGIWYNGANEIRMARRCANTPSRGTERFVSMRSNDTRTPSKSEYCTMNVPTGGKLAETVSSVSVMVDSRTDRRLQAYTWVARRNSAGIYVSTRIDGADIRLARVVWELEHGERPTRTWSLNGDSLDARLENISIPGLYHPPKDVDDSDHLAGHSEARHAYIDVRDDLRNRASIELAQREKDAALLGRSSTRAQRKSKGASLPASKRHAILDRDGGICFYCEYEAEEVDHIIPYAHGGTDDDNNLVACCSICNKIASDKVFDTLEQKRDFIRDQYGPWMKKRYRRLLRKLSICADCRKVYNPQEKGATVVLCKACYRADCLGQIASG